MQKFENNSQQQQRASNGRLAECRDLSFVHTPSHEILKIDEIIQALNLAGHKTKHIAELGADQHTLPLENHLLEIDGEKIVAKKVGRGKSWQSSSYIEDDLIALQAGMRSLPEYRGFLLTPERIPLTVFMEFVGGNAIEVSNNIEQQAELRAGLLKILQEAQANKFYLWDPSRSNFHSVPEKGYKLVDAGSLSLRREDQLVVFEGEIVMRGTLDPNQDEPRCRPAKLLEIVNEIMFGRLD